MWKRAHTMSERAWMTVDAREKELRERRMEERRGQKRKRGQSEEVEEVKEGNDEPEEPEEVSMVLLGIVKKGPVRLLYAYLENRQYWPKLVE